MRSRRERGERALEVDQRRRFTRADRPTRTAFFCGVYLRFAIFLLAATVVVHAPPLIGDASHVLPGANRRANASSLAARESDN